MNSPDQEPESNKQANSSGSVSVGNEDPDSKVRILSHGSDGANHGRSVMHREIVSCFIEQMLMETQISYSEQVQPSHKDATASGPVAPPPQALLGSSKLEAAASWLLS